MGLVIDRRRVGILAMQQGGKSTFITSLGNHLRAHDPEEFPLGSGTTRIEFRGMLPSHDNTPPFPYTQFRQQLADKQWPGKTTAMSEYRCKLSFSRPGWKGYTWAWSETDLSLVDIPGERLADMSMAGATYAEWSDSLLEVLEKYDYLQESREYLHLLESGQRLDTAAVVTEFKKALARLVFKEMPVITPSTLTVTPHGEYVPKHIRRRRDAAALAQVHFVGLDQSQEFAPLSTERRAANPELAVHFETHYTSYREEIVRRLSNKFFACDQLVILIDPTALLAGGVGMYNGCRHMLNVALQYLDPGHTTGQRLADSGIQFMTGGRVRLHDVAKRLPGWDDPVPCVRQIAFVVSQADKVHRDDRDQLVHLVRAMTEPLLAQAQATKWLTVKYFTCAAVNSSVSGQYPELEVLPFDDKDRPEKATRFVKVSPVPSTWPKTWAADAFFYPRFAPITPERADCPPTHFGLNKVAEFMFGL